MSSDPSPYQRGGGRSWEKLARMYLRYRTETTLPRSEIAPVAPVSIPGVPAAAIGAAINGHAPRPDARPYLPVVKLRGIELHAITEHQCIDYILDALDRGLGGTVVTPNLDILRRCRKDLNFAAWVSEADIVVPDGMPLIWASRLQGTPLPQRVAGSDLITSLSIAAANRGKSIFLLGGEPGTADNAAHVLRGRAPHIKIVGTHCPPVGFEENPAAMSAMVDALTNARPDIVWVGLGSPKQERLVNRIRDLLPHSWWLGVGISFSFLTGHVQRAPRWMQKTGLEWAHRLYQEPGRLVRRYIIDGLPFAAGLMASAARNRLMAYENLSGMGHRFRGRNKRRSTPMRLVKSEPEINGAAVAESAPSTQERGDLQVFSSSESSSGTRGLSRLKAVILLGGRVRETELSSSIDRSVLDLPLDDSQSILNHWVAQCTDLRQRLGLEQFMVRVMVDQKNLEPKSVHAQYQGMYRVERDRSSFRGTGGVLADITAEYADDDLILVGNANQVLLDPLWAISQALAHKNADISLLSHRDGTAGGLMLLACKTLRSISGVGYVDMKEQALPKIAQSHEVRVVHAREATGVPLFSLTDYMHGLLQHYRRQGQRRARANPLAEDLQRHFVVVEPGAVVDATAYLHDSVILKGATVEPGAAVMRSLVCSGGIVRRSRQVGDSIVTVA